MTLTFQVGISDLRLKVLLTRVFGPGFHAAPLLLRLLVLDVLEGAQSVMQTTVPKWGLVWGWTGLVVGGGTLLLAVAMP